MLRSKFYEINLYYFELIWDSIYNVKVDLFAYMKHELKYILFKYLPYRLKELPHIAGLNFNMSNLNWKNRWMYDIIVENPELIKQKENVFQFVYTEGAHPPFDDNKDLNFVVGGTYQQKIESCIVMLDAYIQRLKANNSYDNSVIIIMSDHGYNTASEYISEEDTSRRYHPILLIKGFNENHDLIESDLPVSYMDLIDTYSNLLEGRQSTELFENITQERKRIFLLGREGDIIEYETEGKADEIERFKTTGNVYQR